VSVRRVKGKGEGTGNDHQIIFEKVGGKKGEGLREHN
jgi:hypothetical protein